MAELLPDGLACAAAGVLPVDAVGLSLMSQGFRVPLGASNDEAAAAERLQFTSGEGPCLQALQERSEVRASGADMARRWPAFYSELLRVTGFHSIASVPLLISPLLHGGVDFYFRDPAGALQADLDDATEVAALMAAVLRLDPTPGAASLTVPDESVPAWSQSPSAVSRFRVWIATGMLMCQFATTTLQALARLQAYAWGTGQDLDDVTDALLAGRLDPAQLSD